MRKKRKKFLTYFRVSLIDQPEQRKKKKCYKSPAVGVTKISEKYVIQ